MAPSLRLCINCNFGKVAEGSNYCEHPSNISPVDGEFINISCWNMRLDSGACGRYGNLFQIKNNVKFPPAPSQ